MQTNGGAHACKTCRLVVLLLLCTLVASVQYCRQNNSRGPSLTVTPQPVIYELRGTVAQPGIYRYTEIQTTAALAAACGAENASRDKKPLKIGSGTRLIFSGENFTAENMNAAALLSYHQQISLHTATAEDLELIPGIGPKTACALIDYSKRSGPLQSIEQLIEARGIGPKTLKKIARYLRP